MQEQISVHHTNSVAATIVQASLTAETDSMKQPSNIQIDQTAGKQTIPAEASVQESAAQDESYVFRPLGDYQVEVPKIIARLTSDLQQCFAPAETLFREVLSGYDPHFLLITAAQNKDQIKGLLIFN